MRYGFRMGGAEVDETLRSTAAVARSERFAVGSLAGGRYRITRYIASGGMGEVYAAHDVLLDTTVALKTLRPELEGSTTAVARLRREIALARTVTDPHICRLHDVGEHEGRVFLTMELLEGRTLAEIVKQGQLSLEYVERIAKQLVKGLSALHAASIIHRDFKTSNVIVVDEGQGARAVITDFGLARSMDAEDQRLTLESSMLGTPAYMAPEQVEARPAASASDIYSFGVVLFELLTGALPFHEDTAMATATARLQKPPPRPSSLRPGLPSRWDAIVLRCLEREPGARFAHIDDVFAVVQGSRRWFLAAGGGALALASLGLWRLRAGESEPAITPAMPTITDEDVVAVLPVEGTGELFDDAWRAAITLDLHDELATAGVPLLAVYGTSMKQAADGAAIRLCSRPDPVAAAFAQPKVCTVVRTSIVARTPERIEIEVTTLGRRAEPPRLFSRPLSEVALLVSDLALAITRKLGFRAPIVPRDTAAVTAEVYERYGHALASLHRPLTDAEKASITQGAQPSPAQPLAQLVSSVPALARAAVVLANRDQAKAEQLESSEEATQLLSNVTHMLDRALEIDPERALAHATRGRIAMLQWDWRLADAETQRAAELSPGDERVAHNRNFFLMLSGRFEEAIARVERYFARDPNERLGSAKLGWHYYYGRRFPDVVRVVEPALANLRLDVWNESMTVAVLALSYAEMARFADAIALAERMRAAKVDNYVLAGLVPAYVMAGRIEDAKTIRAQIGAGTDLGLLAVMDDALGDAEGALTKLEQVVASHNIHAIFLKMERYSPQLRSHPRFQALLRTVGFV